jgi:hypothetical protein
MKRILISLSIAIVLLLASVYLFIPNRISISEKVTVPASKDALLRKLGNSSDWHKWWPDKTMADSLKGIFLLNGIQYKIADKKTLSLSLNVSGKDLNILTDLTFIPENTENSIISFNGVIPTSYNPIKRVQRFFIANKIKKGIPELLQSIKSYHSNTFNLYGYDIQKKRVVDSTLLSTSKEIKGYPSTAIVYSLIDELKNYIQQQSANETGYPMLNIFTKDSITYLVKVAIPVDKKLPSSGNISYRWMLGGGNILITEVKGDNQEIQKAYTQIQQYISDYKRVAPAIPFESLVTDRRKQPDSSQWITKIYYPVM